MRRPVLLVHGFTSSAQLDWIAKETDTANTHTHGPTT
jgi:hypothetical protein